MRSTGNFTELIKDKYSSLSKAQKKAADYIFQNMDKVAFSTAVQIGMEAGVSDTTVIRLAYTLGFRNFSEMQEVIRKQFLDEVNPGKAEGMPIDTASEQDADYIANVIGKEINCLNQLYKKMNLLDVKRAAAALLEADQVLIMGYFYAFTAAYEFYLNLSMMRDNVFFYRTTETEYHRLYNLTEKSVVIAVSYPTDMNDLLKFMEEAQKRGAQVISVTNSELSRSSREADISFVVDISVDNETGYILQTSAIVLLYFIIMSMKEQNREKVMPYLENVRANLLNYYKMRGSDL